MEKANVTLYTVIGDSNRIVEAIRERFKEMTKEFVCEDETIDLTLPDGTHVIFSIKHRMSKPDFIASHISGMANYFSQVKTPLVGLKENVLLQIRVFNCVTGITFDLNDNEDRTNYILNRLFEIAGDVNGFLLYPSMQIFTGEGKLLFSAKGESQLTEFIPVGNADLLDGNYQEEAQADVERRLRSIALLEEKHVPYMEYLRSEALESEARLRSRKEMVQRAAALFAVAVYSEVMLSGGSGREEALFYFNKMEQLYEVESYLSPAEAAIFWQHKGIGGLLSKGFSRSQSEILDAADITLRYDWACVEARVHGKEAPASLNGDVVMERHYAFNWIIGANGGADWDDIQPNT